MIFDQMASELANRGNSYARYLLDGKPADFWLVTAASSQPFASMDYQDQPVGIGDIPQAAQPMTPVQPLAHPPVTPQFVAESQPETWAQPAAAPEEQPFVTATGDPQTTQPMRAIDQPRPPHPDAGAMQTSWTTQTPLPHLQPVQIQQTGPDFTHLPPRPPMAAGTLVPPPGTQSPIERGASVWGNIAEQG